jgi:hypothetical protein
MGGSEDFFTIEECHERLYDEGRRLFLRGKYDEAIEPFKRIYEATTIYRDVAQIVEDFYGMDSRQKWVSKYVPRFQNQGRGR